MELAKITAKGQITIPISVRRSLGVRDGDKVLFVKEGSGFRMINASMDALMDVQKEFAGTAEKIGIKNEQDVVDMVKDIRAERSGDYKCE